MKNKKIPAILVFGIILIVTIVIGGLIWLNSKKDITPNKAKSTINQDRITKQIVCTQEVKLCPDGSYVSRTGPNCEFTECPVIYEQ
jgi:hypothetical protein